MLLTTEIEMAVEMRTEIRGEILFLQPPYHSMMLRYKETENYAGKYWNQLILISTNHMGRWVRKHTLSYKMFYNYDYLL